MLLKCNKKTARLAIVDEQAETPFVQIKKYVSIDYSATNSYGGRIRDTYYWDADGSKISGGGYSAAELKGIIDMKSKEIIEKAKSVK